MVTEETKDELTQEGTPDGNTLDETIVVDIGAGFCGNLVALVVKVDVADHWDNEIDDKNVVCIGAIRERRGGDVSNEQSESKKERRERLDLLPPPFFVLRKKPPALWRVNTHKNPTPETRTARKCTRVNFASSRVAKALFVLVVDMMMIVYETIYSLQGATTIIIQEKCQSTRVERG